MGSIDLTPSEQWAAAKFRNIESVLKAKEYELDALKGQARQAIDAKTAEVEGLRAKMEEELCGLVDAIARSHGLDPDAPVCNDPDCRECFGCDDAEPRFSADNTQLIW